MSSPMPTLKPEKALIAGMASIITVGILIVLKAGMFYVTGSTSILATLMDSLADATVSVMTFFVIRFSLKPADDNHRSGHGKIEGLAAVFQACFIAAAAFVLLFESFRRLHDPQPIQNHEWGIAVMVVSIVLSLILLRIQKQVLKEAPSLAVEADHAHYATDIIVNAGVIIVLLGLMAGAPAWIDSVFGILMTCYLLHTARDIGWKGMDMLLDRELPVEIRDAIKARVRAHPEVKDMHDLRTSRSGMRLFITFDIEVDGMMTLTAAHDISRAIEHELLQDYPHAEIMIHIDPEGDPHDTRHYKV